MKAAAKRFFRYLWLAEIVARIFALQPREKIWQWAERKVFLTTTMAPEPMFYDSAKTPWTRRIQELWQHPYHNGRRIRRIVVKKSSQTGFTEAILNCMRWDAVHSPRNCIYAIDSQEEATNISDRFRNTLDALGEEILTDDKKDVTAHKITLRHSRIWFFGSGASGKFANKQAPRVVCDEIEEYKKLTGETSTVGNAASRMKKSREGLLVELSKPKLKDGPIDKDHALGNQEIFIVPCPHCGTYQPIEFERLEFRHCKNLMGEWDKERVHNETYLECARNVNPKTGKKIPESADFVPCPPILESNRAWMVASGRWFETGVGSKTFDPEVISQEMSDLYDLDNPRVWGEIAKEIIDAAGDHKLRQEKYNHRLGRAYIPYTVKPNTLDVLRCKGGYSRKTIPFMPQALILASDVGKHYVKWGIGAFNDADDLALLDWGHELHPFGLVRILQTARYRLYSDRNNADAPLYVVNAGIADSGHKMEDTYAACMQIPGKLFPCKGGGGPAMKQTLHWSNIDTFPGLQLLLYNDRQFKNELYLQRIKRSVPEELEEADAKEFLKKMPRLLLPDELTPDIIPELSNESYEEDPETGEWGWNEKKPNEMGDILKMMCVFWRWYKRQLIIRIQQQKQAEATE